HGRLSLASSARRRPPRTSPLLPYTTLFRSGPPSDRGLEHELRLLGERGSRTRHGAQRRCLRLLPPLPGGHAAAGRRRLQLLPLRDRKSTRLNSSHVSISYAVFCLKKKNQEA